MLTLLREKLKYSGGAQPYLRLIISKLSLKQVDSLGF